MLFVKYINEKQWHYVRRSTPKTTCRGWTNFKVFKVFNFRRPVEPSCSHFRTICSSGFVLICAFQADLQQRTTKEVKTPHHWTTEMSPLYYNFLCNLHIGNKTHPCFCNHVWHGIVEISNISSNNKFSVRWISIPAK